MAAHLPAEDLTNRLAHVDEPDDDLLKLTDQMNLLPFNKLVIVVAGLAICAVISTADAAMTATALPTISAHFNAGSVVSWFPSAFMLTSTCFQPLYGRFSDIFGRKVVLCFVMLIFMAACLVAGFSRNYVELVVWRGIAGVGGGGIMSLVQIIMSDIVSLRERDNYSGIILFSIVTGSAIGPPIGGVLSEKVSWRWCFWVTLPILLVTTCVILFTLPSEPIKGDTKRKLFVVDYLGTGLTLSGLTLILLPLIWGGVTFPWNSSMIVALLCFGILVIFMFCSWEWKGSRHPILPAYIFKHVTISGVLISMFVNGFICIVSLYYLPQFFVFVLGYSPILSGVFLLPLLLGGSITNLLVGIIISRTGKYRAFIYAGFSILAVACGCLSTVNPSTPKGLLVFYLILAGVGAGQTMQTTTLASQACVSGKDIAVVTAVRNFAHQLGGTLALAIASASVNNSLRDVLISLSLSTSTIKAIINNPGLLGSNTSPAQLASLGLGPTEATYALLHGYMIGFRWLAILNACLASIAMLASTFMIKHHELLRGDEDRLEGEAKQALESGDGRDEKDEGKLDVCTEVIQVVRKQ